MKRWQIIHVDRKPAAKAKAPDGGLRWPRGLRMTPWRPRNPVRRRCLACSKALRRDRIVWVGESIVITAHGPLYTYGGMLCLGHPQIYELAPCPCGQALYVSRGPYHRRGRIAEAEEYLTRKGDVVRECPGCQRSLSATPRQERAAG